jgi:Uma2 family endonuclease
MRGVPRETRARDLPLLVNGERMKQPEFHRRYEAYPDDVKIELIGGTVYVASPLGIPHGEHDSDLNGVFWLYKNATPGIQLLHNTTTILGEESEPQPDLALRIRPEFGGRSRETGKIYVKGPPELLAEIAHSTRDIDLYRKKEDYRQAGVVEYLVLCVEERELHWFHFPSGRPIKPNRQGISRSRVFPGLWIDAQALLALNSARLVEVIQQGLASKEHVRFVKRLQAAHRRRSPK